jgi:hypothetical protein
MRIQVSKISTRNSDIIKSSQTTSRAKWLNREKKTNVSRTISILVLRVLKWLEFPSPARVRSCVYHRTVNNFTDYGGDQGWAVRGVTCRTDLGLF